jgi:hypothetical protein
MRMGHRSGGGRRRPDCRTATPQQDRTYRCRAGQGTRYSLYVAAPWSTIDLATQRRVPFRSRKKRPRGHTRGRRQWRRQPPRFAIPSFDVTRRSSSPASSPSAVFTAHPTWSHFVRVRSSWHPHPDARSRHRDLMRRDGGQPIVEQTGDAHIRGRCDRAWWPRSAPSIASGAGVVPELALAPARARHLWRRRPRTEPTPSVRWPDVDASR